MEIQPPTIRGLFVNTHIRAVQRAAGAAGLGRLRRLYGQSLAFGNLQEVPVAEEVRLINAALTVLLREPIPPERWDYEAGRLHFHNFSSTALGRLLLSYLKHRFKDVLLISPRITSRIFSRLEFQAEELGDFRVRLVLENNDYPLLHFSGFFEAWLERVGLIGMVRATALSAKRHEYVITWKKPGEAEN